MKRLLEKILTASDKTVVAIAVVFATLVMAWTLVTADEFSFECGVMVVAYAWLIVEAVYFEED